MAQQLAEEGAAISGSSTANISDNESLAKAQTAERLPLFTSPHRAQSTQTQRKTLKRFPNLEFTLYLSRMEKDKPAAHVWRGLHEIRAQLKAPCCCTQSVQQAPMPKKASAPSHSSEKAAFSSRIQKKRQKKKTKQGSVRTASQRSVSCSQRSAWGSQSFVGTGSGLSELKNVPASRQSKSTPVCVCVCAYIMPWPFFILKLIQEMSH